MFAVTYRKIFFAITGALVAASLIAIAVFGLNIGIDFTGGALLEVTYEESAQPERAALEERLGALPIGGFSLRPVETTAGAQGYILRTRDLTEEERQAVLAALSPSEGVTPQVERFTSIGPVIGQELRSKAFVALGIVIAAIILFIAFAFRKVSKPVSSWRYGLIAIVALVHDILVPVGVFAILGAVAGVEIDILFVMALLAILGYSINDTIIVFDRVRDNLKKNQEFSIKEDFEITVGKSLNQTMRRSINTSLTTVLVLLALFFFGAAATQDFALTLLVGVIAGTYSSIFLAAPLLVVLGRWGKSRA